MQFAPSHLCNTLLRSILILLPGTGQSQSTGAIEERLRKIDSELAGLPDWIPSLQTHQRIGHHGYEADLTFVTIDLGETVVPDRVVLFPARLPVSGKSVSHGFPSALDIEIDETADFSRPVRITSWKEPAPGSGEQLPFLSFPGNGAGGRFLRIRVTGLREDPLREGMRYFRLGEVIVLSDGQNAALKRPVTSSPGIESPRRWEPSNLTDGYLWCRPLRGIGDSPSNGFLSGPQKKEIPAEETWVEVDLGSPHKIDEIHLVAAHPRELADSFGYGFPPRFWILADVGHPTEQVILREVDPPYPAEGLPNPGDAQVLIAPDNLVARTIRMKCETISRVGPVSGRGQSRYVFALGELQVWRNGTNLAEGKPVHYSHASEEQRWSPEALVDGFSSHHPLLSWKEWIHLLDRRQQLQAEAQGLRLQQEQLDFRKRERILAGSVAAAVIAILLSIILVLVLRSRAEHSREELRNRIARDLHDEIGASLSHLAMQSDLARRQLAEDSLPPEKLERISSTARETLDNMRDIIWLLTPRKGTWADLSDRLETISTRLLEGLAHEVAISGTLPEGEPPIQWSREIVAFLKEALTNVRKHSEATKVAVTMDWLIRDRNGVLEITVTDDGVGFDPAQSSGGSGLGNMRTRAKSLKGSLRFESESHRATLLRLEVPIPPHG